MLKYLDTIPDYVLERIATFLMVFSIFSCGAVIGLTIGDTLARKDERAEVDKIIIQMKNLGFCEWIKVSKFAHSCSNK